MPQEDKAFTEFKAQVRDNDSGLTFDKLFRIWWVLRKKQGRPSAIQSSALCKTTGLNESSLRRGIMVLRRSGFDICSGATGYFRSKDQADVLATIDHLESRAKSLMETARLLREQLGDQGVQDKLSL